MHDLARNPARAMLVAKNVKDIGEFALVRRFTASAALGPLRSIRMSSGPSRMNEKPRSASSIWKDDTPRSSMMPSTVSRPSRAGSPQVLRTVPAPE